MKLDDVYSTVFKFSQDEVIAFAEVTGDKNPIHVDSAYAKDTKFEVPIMHGYLSASIFSRIIGMEFPGEGSIYLKQNLKFLKPMFVDKEYVVNIRITDIDFEKKFISLDTIINNPENGENTIVGDALVYFPKLQ